MHPNDALGAAPAYILVVEDCAEQRVLLCHILKKNKYRVHATGNAQEAILKISEEKPCMIISDVDMPEMDGLEFCRAIKGDAALNHIPVVLLTAFWGVKSFLRGLEAGADYYFMKPMDSKLLLSRTAKILDTHPVPMAEDDGIANLIYHFEGEKHAIPHSRGQILKMLISSHEIAIGQNQKILKDKLNP